MRPPRTAKPLSAKHLVTAHRYIRGVSCLRSPALVVAIITVPVVARAGGLVVVSGSPRAIGRAGTGTVGDDGGGALLINPAAMARRETKRVQLGIGSVDDAISWQSDNADAPLSRDQAGSHVTPTIAAQGLIGKWVVGVGAMTASVGERSLRPPGSTTPEQFMTLFDYRYAGIHSFTRRDTIVIGAARRIGDTVAVGASVAASRIKLAETRHIWAGFSGRDTIGDPLHDAELEMGGEDPLSPSAVVGVLVAPAGTPLEIGASIGWNARMKLEGSAIGFGSMGGTATVNHTPTSSLALRQPLALRGGVRYLAERLAVEVDYDLWLAPASAGSATWAVDGIRVVDPSGVGVDLTSVPSRLSVRTHGALRTSTDVELIAGFLWATAGYAYTTSSTPAGKLSPTFADLPGHTFALGLEGTAGGVTVTLGWSRTYWPVTHAQESDLRLDNPFDAGDRAVVGGSYGGSSDQIGILVDVELETPAP